MTEPGSHFQEIITGHRNVILSSSVLFSPRVVALRRARSEHLQRLCLLSLCAFTRPFSGRANCSQLPGGQSERSA